MKCQMQTSTGKQLDGPCGLNSNRLATSGQGHTEVTIPNVTATNVDAAREGVSVEGVTAL